jgi:prolipoprotein diacylglyceryltransferase
MHAGTEPSGGERYRPNPPEPALAATCQWLDRFAAGDMLPLHGVPAYTIFGFTGMVVGFVVALGLALSTAISLATLVVAATTAVVSFAIISMVRVRLGSRGHVYLQNLLVALAAASAVPFALGEPVGPLLDVVMVGLGTMTVFGRLGCLASGCCHGRPSVWGVRYGPDSAVASPLVGLRLFPLQLAEAIWSALVTAVALALVLGRAAATTATWWWLLAYGAGRFVLELARGDENRRRIGPLSEAQWTAVGLLVARIAIEESSWTEPRVLSLAMVPIAAVAIALVARGWFADQPLSLQQAPIWRGLLDGLEHDARTSAAPAARTGPWPDWTVSLHVLPAGGDAELHCFALEHPGVDASRAWAFAGWVLGRAPEHVVLRAGCVAADRFELWVLMVCGRDRSGAHADDSDWEAWIRAQAFATAARRLSTPWPARPFDAEPARRVLDATAG